MQNVKHPLIELYLRTVEAIVQSMPVLFCADLTDVLQKKKMNKKENLITVDVGM
jgi:hypothetical protein